MNGCDLLSEDNGDSSLSNVYTLYYHRDGSRSYLLMGTSISHSWKHQCSTSTISANSSHRFLKATETQPRRPLIGDRAYGKANLHQTITTGGKCPTNDLNWTFLPWQLGPARVVGNWQRGNSPPTKTARGLTKHRFMGMCLWVWLKGGSWKIMQHLNHQFGLPKEWTRNKDTCAVIWRYLLACCLSPQGSRMRHWVYQRDTIWLKCLPLHVKNHHEIWSFTIHVHVYESTINFNKLISSSHELRINSVYLQHHQPPMLNLF